MWTTSSTTTLQLLPQLPCVSSEHNNRNCPVSGKITPAEVAGSSWGLVCVLAGRVRGAGGGSGRGSGGGGSGHHPTSVPSASAANATSEQ